MLYYRVETVNVEKLEIRGGYMAAMDTLLLKRLNLKPGTPVEELAEAVERSADPEVQELWISASLLCDIPYPDEYSGDRKNTVCLYNEIEYEEAEPELEYISELLIEYTNGKLALATRAFDIPNEELLYEDEYQVVVSKETYEKYAPSLDEAFYLGAGLLDEEDEWDEE